MAGRDKRYCHIEKLTNLDKIPMPHGFKVAVFPVKIARASAGWVRPAAIIEEAGRALIEHPFDESSDFPELFKKTLPGKF